MLRIIVRRLAQLIPAVFVLSLLMFVWLRSLPGGPAAALLGDKATPRKIADMNRIMGLDQPWYVQYSKYLGRILTGDFGSSLISGDTVTAELARSFPATIELSLTALLFAVVLGIPLGYVSARHRGRLLDNATVFGTLLGVAVPVFFLGYLLKQFVAVEWGLLPPSGRLTAGMNATTITGFDVFDGLLTGEYDASWDALKHLVLPAITLGTIPLAIITRITRASVLEVFDEDYVRTAESKGLKASTIRGRHVLRNALLPVVTTVGLQTGLLLAGAVLTEKVFAWNGLGSLLAQGVERRDYPRLQAIILFAAVIYIVVNLLVDLAYSVIDPRVRVR